MNILMHVYHISQTLQVITKNVPKKLTSRKWSLKIHLNKGDLLVTMSKLVN